MFCFDIHRGFGHEEVQSDSGSDRKSGFIPNFVDDLPRIAFRGVIMDFEIIGDIEKGFIDGIDEHILLTYIFAINIVDLGTFL